MVSGIDSNGVLTRKQREELVVDLYFNQNKTMREIAKIARISPRDIGNNISKANQEKERQEHKSLKICIEIVANAILEVLASIELNLRLLAREDVNMGGK